MVELGIKGRQETTVTTANVATNVGSGKVQVFATPMMVATNTLPSGEGKSFIGACRGVRMYGYYQ